jgi:hypothetical protein
LIVSELCLGIFQIHGLQFQYFLDSCAKAVAELRVTQLITSYRFLSLLGYARTCVLDVAIVVQHVVGERKYILQIDFFIGSKILLPV